MADMPPPDIDEYIKTYPQETREILQKVRQTIKNAAPKALEAFSYGVPAFKIDGKDLVLYAAFKNHIGFYPTPGAIKAFENELKPYKQAKGSVQFPLDKPMPLSLIARIVEFRLQELT